MDRAFSIEEKSRLTQLINEGMTVTQEIDDLQGSLNDTIKAVAEEMELKPSLIKKAIKIAMKGDFDRHSEEYATLENILGTTGKI